MLFFVGFKSFEGSFSVPLICNQGFWRVARRNWIFWSSLSPVSRRQTVLKPGSDSCVTMFPSKFAKVLITMQMAFPARFLYFRPPLSGCLRLNLLISSFASSSHLVSSPSRASERQKSTTGCGKVSRGTIRNVVVSRRNSRSLRRVPC